MKKFSAIMLTSLYLLLSVGVWVNMHYCSGRLMSVGVFADIDDCCCGDEEMMSDCCADDSHFFQLDEDQQLTQINTKIPVPEFQTIAVLASLVLPETPAVKQKALASLKAPPPDGQAIWLKNCQLITYG